MAAGDVTNELMYELMKSMPDRMVRMDGGLKAIRGHVVALVQGDLLRGSELVDLTRRVERIERRLDLHDPAV